MNVNGRLQKRAGQRSTTIRREGSGVIMTHPIFQVGDRVTLNNKAPKWILQGMSPYVARTVRIRYYYPKYGYALYFLGYNGRGVDITHIGFRAYMLDVYIPLPTDRTYKRAQSLQSQLQKTTRDNIARTGKADSH